MWSYSHPYRLSLVYIRNIHNESDTTHYEWTYMCYTRLVNLVLYFIFLYCNGPAMSVCINYTSMNIFGTILKLWFFLENIFQESRVIDSIKVAAVHLFAAKLACRPQMLWTSREPYTSTPGHILLADVISMVMAFMWNGKQWGSHRFTTLSPHSTSCKHQLTNQATPR